MTQNLRKFSALFLVLLSGVLSSCIDDQILGPEVVPRLTYRPNGIYYRFNEFTGGTKGDITIHWLRSSSDTQQNFRGYFVRLYTAEERPNALDSTLEWMPAEIVAERHVDKSQLSTVFNDLDILKPYIAAVWGERKPSPERPDSVILSFDSAGVRFVFDPRPLANPTALRAASTGPNTVLLEWDPPPANNRTNLLGYTVHYSDARKVKDSGFTAVQTTFDSSASITVPDDQTSSEQQHFKFWVKAIRIDSLDSKSDSTVITWSGAQRIQGPDSGVYVPFDRGVFIGNIQGRFDALVVSNDSSIIRFELDGSNIRIIGNQGTKLSGRTDAASKLDTAILSQPLPDSDFDQDAITISGEAPRGGVMFYARTPDGRRARIVMLARNGQLALPAVGQKPQGVLLQIMYQPGRFGDKPVEFF